MNSNLAAFSAELESAVQGAERFVVAVQGQSRMPTSGIAWGDDIIVTVDHGLKHDGDVQVHLPDGRALKAAVVGHDPGTDLGVLRVSEKLEAAPRSDANLRPGHVVLTLGRSPNSGINAAMGIVSAVSGPWRTWRGGQMDAYIRLDMRLFAGSAGGAVIADGLVAGVASGALSRVAPLAVPVSTVQRVVSDILSTGRVSRGFLGVGLQPVRIPEALQQFSGSDTGVIVLSVEAAGPADLGGLLIGDVIVALAGSAVQDTDDVQAALGRETIGKPVSVKILRAGQAVELEVVVGERR